MPRHGLIINKLYLKTKRLKVTGGFELIDRRLSSLKTIFERNEFLVFGNYFAAQDVFNKNQMGLHAKRTCMKLIKLLFRFGILHSKNPYLCTPKN